MTLGDSRCERLEGEGKTFGRETAWLDREGRPSKKGRGQGDVWRC